LTEAVAVVVRRVAVVLQVVVEAALIHEAVVAGLNFEAVVAVNFEAEEAVLVEVLVALGIREGKLFT
jgi:hypothetical protein